MVAVMILTPHSAFAQNKQEPAANVAEWSAASELLARARKLVDQKGWQQGALAPDTRVCMAQAMELAFKDGKYSIVDFNYARDAMSQAIKVPRDQPAKPGDPLDVPYWGRSFMEWNDKRGRTKKDVLSAFDTAITLAKKKKVSAMEKASRQRMIVARTERAK